MTQAFGNIISPSQVEDWVVTFAERWFLEYLAATEREMGLPPRHYPPLRSITVDNDFDHWVEDQLPALVIMNTGLAEAPAKRSGGYDATWVIGAAIIVSARSRAETRRAMNDYGTAFRTMVLQTRSLERPEVRGVTWVDERPAPIPDESGRTLGAQQMFFNVEVEAVAEARAVPPSTEPRPDPYPTPVPSPVPGVGVIDSFEVEINQVGSD